MDSPVLLVLIGGLISLVSSAVTGFLQHRWEKQKLNIQSRQHFTQIVYSKQIEFFDKLYPILGRLNSYLTGIDVRLADNKSKQVAKKDAVLMEFNELKDQYSAYLPKGLLDEVDELLSQCTVLGIEPNKNAAAECLERLARFQNVMREFAGIDKLSTDLMKALGKDY